jgi:hypothetical protein
MQLSDLIETLQERLEEHGDAQVLIAHQQNYPLAIKVREVTYLPKRHPEDDHKDTFWIAGGDHPASESPYAPKEAWDGEDGTEEWMDDAGMDEDGMDS